MPAFGRILSDFPKLTAAEKRLIANCRLGTVTELRADVPDKSSARVCIRGGLIRFLALGGDTENPVHENGIRLVGAWIDGDVDLDDCSLSAPLTLGKCHIPGLSLRRARLPALSLSGCVLPAGFDATGMECRGHVDLDNGFHSGGQVCLQCARIGGILLCSNGRFDHPGSAALLADSAEIKGGVFLNEGFHASGTVRFASAAIGGTFECNNARFENGSIDALSVENAEIKGSVFLCNGFHASGVVRLMDASIAGNVECMKGRFENPGGEAICADRARIKGGVYFDQGFHASGEVRLMGATIGSGLSCGEGVFDNEGGNALSMDGTDIAGGAIFNQGFQANGAVRLIGATIGANMTCNGGRFSNGSETALMAEQMIVKGSVFLRHGFRATGIFSLVGASIGGDFCCEGSSFENLGGTALDLEGARIAQCWRWHDVEQFDGLLDARLLHTGSLLDDAASWTYCEGNLILDGLRYDRFARGAPTDAAMRIGWLKQQAPDDLDTEFRPQPWEQCASVLKAMGHPNAARQVMIEKERTEQAAGRHGKPGSARRLSYGLYGWLTAYGYWPINLLRMTVGLYLIATLAFWIAANPRLQPGAGAYYIAPAGTLLPSPECVARAPSAAADGDCPPLVPGYNSFFAPAYVLETMLPISTLRRAPEWKVRLEAADGDLLLPGLLLQGFSWLVSLWGWLASILLILWLGKLIRRD